MADIERIINLTTKLNNKGLKDLEQGLEKVEKKSKLTTNALDNGIKNSEKSANNLKGGLGGVVTEFKTITKAAKTGGAAMRSAFISTGIGALVVALGFVVEHWEDILKYVGLTNESLEEQREYIKSNITLVDNQLKLLKSEKEYNDDRKISNEENLQNQKDLLKYKQDLLKEDIKLLEAQLVREESASKEIGWFKKLLNLRAGTVTTNEDVVTEEEQKRINDIKAQIIALKGDVIDVDNILFDLENPKSSKSSKNNKREKEKSVNAGLLTDDEQQALLDKQSKQFSERFDLDALNKQALIDLNKSALETITNDENILNAQRTKDAEAWAKRREEIAYEEQQYKREVLFAEADLLQNFGSLLQQLGEENKTLAIAGIIAEQVASVAKVIISTTEANAKAVAISPLTAGQPWVTLNTVSAGLGIASSIAAATKAITALGGGGGVQGGSLPQGGQSAPSFNVVGTSGVNQLAQTLNQDQQPIEAFVVASNVSGAQELNRNIVETATLG